MEVPRETSLSGVSFFVPPKSSFIPITSLRFFSTVGRRGYRKERRRKGQREQGKKVKNLDLKSALFQGFPVQDYGNKLKIFTLF